MEIPGAYRQGYEQARRVDAATAERYLRHVTVGDPQADAVMVELDKHPGAKRHEWIQRGIEGGPDALADAPPIVRDLFAAMEQVPDWYDPEAGLAGCRGFHRDSEVFIGSFVGAVLIEGFSTQISRSFSITGRVIDQGVRRLKQNNRHLVEIFMPGGLDRQSDGWKLSVRIRMVHAQIRHLLRKSPEWETAEWGTPLSAAHIAFATAAFSALLLKRATMLGVTLPNDERAAFMMNWRYSGHLMGVLPEVLFTNEADALHFHSIGLMCEPPPGVESRQMANGLIQAAPIVAGITAENERRKLVKKIYQISRSLIGDELADALDYPKSRTFGVLAMLRWGNQLSHALQRVCPPLARWRSSGQFQKMLELSHFEQKGLAYHMPERVHAEEDKSF